jgi:hypothetical protein
MKKILSISAFMLMALWGISQQNMITVSGGYSFANLEASEIMEDDGKVKTTGWRINGLYEFNPAEGKWAYGFSVGYINLTGNDGSGLDTVDFKVSTVPYYFAPKYIFGKNDIKGYVKGVLGMQSSRLERTGALGTVEASDFGFYGGASVGMMVFLNEMFFLNGEYEFAWMSNSFYTDGLINSAMLGVGIKF